MDLYIINLERALDYMPTNRTYAIGIESAAYPSHMELEKSRLYTIQKYVFDDITPHTPFSQRTRMKLFDESTAGKILVDFREQGLGHDTLLVYCLRGINRSPAVGIALNEIFTLGRDTNKLKKQFPETNWFVYNTLLAAAQKLQIKPLLSI